MILDRGAVIALAARDVTVRRFVERAIQRRTLVVVPAAVVAETMRGGPRDAPVNRVLKAVDVIAPVTEEVARLAGRLLATVERSNVTVDALIVAEAILGEAAIVITGDPDDLSALAANHPLVQIYGGVIGVMLVRLSLLSRIASPAR